MIYTCKDCSYRGKSSGQDGRCPACGSFNFGGQPSEDEASRPARWRLWLLVALWVYLIGLIIWKMFH